MLTRTGMSPILNTCSSIACSIAVSAVLGRLGAFRLGERPFVALDAPDPGGSLDSVRPWLLVVLLGLNACWERGVANQSNDSTGSSAEARAEPDGVASLGLTAPQSSNGDERPRSAVGNSPQPPAESRACQIAESIGKAIIDPIRQRAFGDAPHEEGSDERRWRECQRCWRASDGAWAVVPRQPLPGQNEPKWGFTYIYDNGTRLDFSEELRWCNPEFFQQDATVFDYDGDGREEIALGRVERFWRDHSVYTARSDRIRLYPPTQNLPISQIKDVDSDGRPDLLLTLALGLGGPVCDYEEIEHDATVHSPEFLAHSLPDGTFSTRDAVAQDFIRKSRCTELPTAPVSIDDYVCARVWGRSTKSLLAYLSKTQMPERCHRDENGREIPDRRSKSRKALREGPLNLLKAAARIIPYTRLEP